MHESNTSVHVPCTVVMWQHCTERNTKLWNPEGEKSSFLLCWNPFRFTSLEISAKKGSTFNSCRCFMSRHMCVCMCACVHLLLHIQRDSTCTSKRQLGFQICNQVQGADFFVSSKFLLGQSILRSFSTGFFFFTGDRTLALTWARWIHSTPSNTSSFRYMLGAFWRSSEKWVIASVMMSLCMAVRREQLGYHAADVH